MAQVDSEQPRHPVARKTSDRRGGDRRQGQEEFAGTDRRDSERRSGGDRRDG